LQGKLDALCSSRQGEWREGDGEFSLVGKQRHQKEASKSVEMRHRSNEKTNDVGLAQRGNLAVSAEVYGNWNVHQRGGRMGIDAS